MDEDWGAEDKRARAEQLLRLRHMVACVVKEFAGASIERARGDAAEPFDWAGLLADVDGSLEHWAGGGRRARASGRRSCAPDAYDADVAAGVARGPRPPKRADAYAPAVGDVVSAAFHGKQVRARVVGACVEINR